MNWTYDNAEEFLNALAPFIRTIFNQMQQDSIKCKVGTVKTADNNMRKATILLASSEDTPDQYITLDNYSDCQLFAGDEVWIQYWNNLSNGIIFAKNKTGNEIYFGGESEVTATITVGNTKTLPAGSNAAVRNVGTTSSAILEFDIPAGDTVDFRVSGGYIQWKHSSDSTWKNLVALSTLKGDKGDKGDPGIPVTHSWDGTVLTITSASGTSSANLIGPKGERGAEGKPFKILGTYNTIADLNMNVPSPEIGDFYNVGYAPPYNIYRWSGTTWENNGQINGGTVIELVRW